MAHHNPRLAKLHRSYTVEEVALLYRVHKGTVRGWLKKGLEPIDQGRPLLIRGETLRTFLERQRAAAKRPCPAGTLYCFKCRAPRRPAFGEADFVPREGGAGNLRALCEVCGRLMNRRARASALAAILPAIDVRTVQAPRRLAEPASPSPNTHQQRAARA